MTKTSKSTLRYVAKQGWQLFLTRGINSSTVAGFWIHSLCDEFGTVVLVYSHEGTPENPSELLYSVNPPKSWNNL
jgi:hypothetical protein